MVKINHFYIISDDFFKRFPDPNLRQNKEENRPNYFALQEESGLIWMIPCSKRVKKYKTTMENREKKGLKNDILHIINLHTEMALLISDMFPVTENYIERSYTINSIDLKILDQSQIRVIKQKAKKIRILIDKGVKFGEKQPDVKSIANQLLEDIATSSEAS